MKVRAGLVLIAFALAACGVRGAPTPAPPLLGETSLPPQVPQPYQRSATQTVSAGFESTLGGYEVSEEFPETLPEDRSIRSATPPETELDPAGNALD